MDDKNFIRLGVFTLSNGISAHLIIFLVRVEGGGVLDLKTIIFAPKFFFLALSPKKYLFFNCANKNVFFLVVIKNDKIKRTFMSDCINNSMLKLNFET